MSKATIDEALRRSNPWLMSDNAGVHEALHELVGTSRAEVGGQRSRQRRRSLAWLIPAIGLSMIGLTAGALVVDDAMFPDMPIKISYTTDTGVMVSCTARIEDGSMFVANSGRVVEYLQTRDLSTYGQKIYEHALVLAGDAEPTPQNTPESNIWIPGDGSWLGDKAAIDMSLVDYLLINTQIDLGLHGNGGSLTSDCTGQLH